MKSVWSLLRISNVIEVEVERIESVGHNAGGACGDLHVEGLARYREAASAEGLIMHIACSSVVKSHLVVPICILASSESVRFTDQSFF